MFSSLLTSIQAVNGAVRIKFVYYSLIGLVYVRQLHCMRS